MRQDDPLAGLARHYDVLMSHVNYGRWFTVAVELSALLPDRFRHLDAACGTCALLRKLLRLGWNTMGLDLSVAMLREGVKRKPAPPVVAGDLRALPMVAAFDYVTCLFDSINFLTQPAELEVAFRELAKAIKPNGVLYFDVVTERMILDHFAGRRWTERTGRLSTTWESAYCRQSGIVETRIAVQNEPEHIIRERVYPPAQIEAAVESAGLSLLGVFDAETWEPRRRKTARIDYVAMKGSPRLLKKRLEDRVNRIRALMR